MAKRGVKIAEVARLKIVRGSANIFIDLGFDQAEAENLKLRSDLVIHIVQFYEKSGMTQARAAIADTGPLVAFFDRAEHNRA